jgi:uncharacterized repeat protein (TIGR03803 family)
LHSFDYTDGQAPYGLVQATNGYFYGTTYSGGANDDGTVFKITPTGTLTMLHSFCSPYPCQDGAESGAGLVQANNGDLYGTTQNGGADGYGTVFKITPSGTLMTLHSFDGTDGANPYAGLVQATDRNLYGTTQNGGANNKGTVFKITPSGTLTTLHSFDGTDGKLPYAGLVQTTNGDLYGTTQTGGANGAGTVFKITPSGKLTILYSFCSQSGCTDGELPHAGLVQATNADLYGTTAYGGADADGTVFKITPSGTLTTLHSFDGTDGANPYAGLVQATDGNLYGTAAYGGANTTDCGGIGCGTVFKIIPTGTVTTLYSFCSQSGCTDGDYPVAGLVQDTNGDLYGTAAMGGANGYGTVFWLSVGLGPFVETQPVSGKAGAAVKILGTKLTGAISVKFNGTAAVFKVVSGSLITTTVPAGATTGEVKVKTPRGTLKSNVVFRVK